MNSMQTEPVRPEKALWYQEVLSLDPASRIFLPYARLLAESGRRTEAVDILKAGLLRHPEFLEARLLLIDLLYATGQEKAAALEASPIVESLSRCSALWKIWSTLPGVRADQAAMLLFFGATFKNGGPGLAEVFEAGMKALGDGEESALPEETSAPLSAAPSSAPEEKAAFEEPTPARASEPAGEETPGATQKPCFVMDENTPWYSLDSVPEDDDLPDDEEIPAPAAPLSPSVSELFFSDNAGNAAPAQEEGQEAYAPAAHPVPRSPLEGKSSLRTRSMARVLEEQGAFSEAADIYRELLEVSTSEEERAELCARLEHLSQGAENAAAQPASSGILDMLETLAVRLENKSRA